MQRANVIYKNTGEQNLIEIPPMTDDNGELVVSLKDSETSSSSPASARLEY